MRDNILGFINKLIPALIMALAFVLPLFFLPITADFFEFPKQVLLLAVSCLLLAAWAVKMVLEKQVRVIRTPFDVPVALLVIGYSLLVIFSKNRLISATSLSTWTFPALGILYFVAVSNLKTKRQLFNCSLALLLGGGILSVWAVLNYFANFQFSIFNFQITRAFSPIGGIATASVYLLATAALAVARLRAIGNRGQVRYFTSLLLRRGVEVATLVAILIAFLLISPLTSGYASKITGVDYPRPVLLDFQTSWIVATETIKNQPIFGVGPGLFAEAFSQFKPLGFNNSLFWNIRFGIAHSQWLQMMTTGGMLGLAVFAFLVFTIVKDLIPKFSIFNFQFPILLLLLSSFVTIWTMPIAFLFFLLLALWQKEEFLEKPDPEREVQISVLAIPLLRRSEAIQSELLPKLIIGPAVIISVFGFFALGRAFAAEVFYKKSLDAIGTNQGVPTYNYQLKAIRWNPYAVRYRLAYSQTNLALANSLSGQEGLTDEDRLNIQQLIQQAIREGRTATRLNPLNPETWANLARLYRGLIGVAEGSEAWAAGNFQEAIWRDPTNPLLRVDLGGIYYGQKDFEGAALIFAEAVQLKPNFANARYNLANALREKGDLEGARREYEITLRLVPQEGVDYETVRREMDELPGVPEATPSAEIKEEVKEATPSAQ